MSLPVVIALAHAAPHAHPVVEHAVVARRSPHRRSTGHQPARPVGRPDDSALVPDPAGAPTHPSNPSNHGPVAGPPTDPSKPADASIPSRVGGPDTGASDPPPVVGPPTDPSNPSHAADPGSAADIGPDDALEPEPALMPDPPGDAAPSLDDRGPEPTLVDPVALFPAGLDPRTLCRIGGACETPPEPMRAAITLGGAQLGYAHHPARLGGDELSARFELWRGLAWSAHVAYLVDTFDQRTATTAVHDLAFGGRIALPLALPTWAIADVHILDGGNAVYGALGAQLGGFDLELGGSAMQLDRDMGTAATLRITRGERWRGWLELAAGTTTIGGMESTQLGGGAGLGIHRTHWSLDVSALVGDRALAVTDGGELAESIADTFHTSGRAVLRIELGGHVAPYAGIAARTATTPDHVDYAQLVGFAGLTFSF